MLIKTTATNFHDELSMLKFITLNYDLGNRIQDQPNSYFKSIKESVKPSFVFSRNLITDKFSDNGEVINRVNKPTFAKSKLVNELDPQMYLPQNHCIWKSNINDLSLR